MSLWLTVLRFKLSIHTVLLLSWYVHFFVCLLMLCSTFLVFFFLFGRNSVQKIIFFVLKTKETKARRSAFTKRVRSYFGFVWNASKTRMFDHCAIHATCCQSISHYSCILLFFVYRKFFFLPRGFLWKWWMKCAQRLQKKPWTRYAN